MTLVEQIMQPPKYTLKTSDSIERALSIILSRSISTCPVVSNTGEFLGQLTDAALMKALILKASGKKIHSVFDLKKMYVMPPLVSRTTPLQVLIQQCFVSKSQRVFVVDARNKVLGVIRPKNLLKFLVKELGFKYGRDDKTQTKILNTAYLRDVEKLKKYAAKKDFDLNALSQKLKDSQSIFLVFDEKQRLVAHNPSAKTILAKSASDKNYFLEDIFWKSSISEIKEFARQSLKLKRSQIQPGNFSIKNSRGREVRYEMSAFFQYSQKKISAIYFVGRPLDAYLLLAGTLIE